MTPSDQVDQAWHLHLVYTRSYWEDLCGEVLGRPVHHGPTKGGTAEGEKFHDWYDKTCQSHQDHFGAAPPADIWPEGEKRFAGRFQRVDLSENLVLPQRVLIFSSIAAAMGVSLASCTDNSEDIGAILFLGLPILLIILFLKSLGGGGGKGGGSGCSSGGFGWFGGGRSNDAGCGSGCGGGGCGGGLWQRLVVQAVPQCLRERQGAPSLGSLLKARGRKQLSLDAVELFRSERNVELWVAIAEGSLARQIIKACHCLPRERIDDRGARPERLRDHSPFHQVIAFVDSHYGSSRSTRIDSESKVPIDSLGIDHSSRSKHGQKRESEMVGILKIPSKRIGAADDLNPVWHAIAITIGLPERVTHPGSNASLVGTDVAAAALDASCSCRVEPSVTSTAQLPLIEHGRPGGQPQVSRYDSWLELGPFGLCTRTGA